MNTNIKTNKQNTITIRNGLLEVKDIGDTVKEVRLFVCFVLLYSIYIYILAQPQSKYDEHEEFHYLLCGDDIINWYDKL